MFRKISGARESDGRCAQYGDRGGGVWGERVGQTRERGLTRERDSDTELASKQGSERKIQITRDKESERETT